MAAPVQRTTPIGGAESGSSGESAGQTIEVKVVRTPRWLVAQFREVHTTASWAIVGGGMNRTQTVAWHQISDAELFPPVDARELLRKRLHDQGLTAAVGLLTSRNIDHYVDITKSYGDLSARCIATVGMGNALRAGDPLGPAGEVAKLGTINVLCRLSVCLSREALLEALALATEARTLAVREASIPSAVSGAPASGTGTDCVVIAAPERGVPARYAGKHTALGHLIGTAVGNATTQGVEQWKREREADQ